MPEIVAVTCLGGSAVGWIEILLMAKGDPGQHSCDEGREGLGIAGATWPNVLQVLLWSKLLTFNAMYGMVVGQLRVVVAIFFSRMHHFSFTFLFSYHFGNLWTILVINMAK